MQRNKIVIALSLVVSSLLVGCSDRVSLADSKMQQIRSQPAQPIKPPPKPEIVPDFNYSASALRSPFIAGSLLLQAKQESEIQGVRPDVTRIQEPLEQFELSELVYKGSVVSEAGELYGLIQQPDGKVYSVKVGNYMGKNHGRIAEITPLQINLIEIVSDSRVETGYVEKPNSIVAAETN